MAALLDYLDRNPNAGDTKRGVRMWLRDLPDTPSAEIVEAALDRLVDQGLIEKRSIAGVVDLFRRRKQEGAGTKN